MVLYNFFVKETDANNLPYQDINWNGCPPNLLGGYVLGDGTDGSFRGKAYASFIKEVTGVDIYDNQDNDTVILIAASLRHYLAERLALDEELALDSFDLWRAFKAYGEAGCRLVAWA
jgi:hypothetical protein